VKTLLTFSLTLLLVGCKTAQDSQPALWVLITIYRRLLERIAARQYDVFAERIHLSVFEKLTILAKGFLKRLS
jgi:phytoene synthase